MKNKVLGLIAVGLLTGPMLAGLGLLSWPSQAVATITPLYPDAAPSRDLTMQAGETRFTYFQALATVDITALLVFGDPELLNASADFRWQLFETTMDWNTPNGNDDRLFYSGQIQFVDAGRTWYETAIVDSLPIFSSRTLTAGSFYLLSFQVANTLWTVPVVPNVPQGELPLMTEDGRFAVFGASTRGDGPPYFSDIPYFAISAVPSTVPEPGTLALLGLGLLGLGFSRRRKNA